MSDKVDVNVLANRKAKGKRPWFFADPDVERVLNICMALAMEHAVTRQRLDALERLLARKGLLERSEIEAFVADEADEAERSRWMQAYIARVLRIVQQSVEGTAATEEPGLERLIEALKAGDLPLSDNEGSKA